MTSRAERPARNRRRRLVAAVAVTATAAATATLLGPGTGNASSHREAPLIAADPQADNTDTYAFVSPDNKDTVTLIANWIPFEEPAGGPNFYQFAQRTHYDINIDNNGDGVADLTYRWTFRTHVRNGNTFLYAGKVNTLSDLNVFQTYSLEAVTPSGTTMIQDDVPVAPSRIGDTSMPDYAALRSAAVKTYGNLSTFAGQAEDPFFLDLRVFDYLYGAPTFSEVAHDTLKGFNVNTIALQVPKAALARNGNATDNPVIGVWSTTSRKALSKPRSGGAYVQVSRLGNPLVNEVVIPLKDKDKFNASTPAQDVANGFGPYVTNPELPKLIEALYGIPAPATPRNDLVSVFLTGVTGLNASAMNKDHGSLVPAEEMRLNMSIAPTAQPNRLGVIAGDNAGYPNGRRLADDVLDISLRVVEGQLVGSPNTLGDGVDTNDAPFGDTFPYVALPVSGSAPTPHG